MNKPQRPKPPKARLTTQGATFWGLSARSQIRDKPDADISCMERWPGYDQQSWQERFAELDRRHEVVRADIARTIAGIHDRYRSIHGDEG